MLYICPYNSQPAVAAVKLSLTCETTLFLVIVISALSTSFQPVVNNPDAFRAPDVPSLFLSPFLPVSLSYMSSSLKTFPCNSHKFRNGTPARQNSTALLRQPGGGREHRHPVARPQRCYAAGRKTVCGRNRSRTFDAAPCLCRQLPVRPCTTGKTGFIPPGEGPSRSLSASRETDGSGRNSNRGNIPAHYVLPGIPEAPASRCPAHLDASEPADSGGACDNERHC